MWSLDRFGRSMAGNVNDALALDAAGVKLISVREPWLDTGGPVRDLLLAIFSWVAEQELRRLVERTRAGIERARAKGTKSGKPIGRPRRLLRVGRGARPRDARRGAIRTRNRDGHEDPAVHRGSRLSQATCPATRRRTLTGAGPGPSHFLPCPWTARPTRNCSGSLARATGTPAASVPPALSTLAPAYRPRRPTETVLYGVVRDYLETFLAHARDSYEAPLPRYVEDELRGYLKCGVFAHGFVRAHCDTCGHDLLVAFSCKARSVCPSCAGRRMANTAANLVDRVLPAVPVRQWVLSLPWELRALAAFKADVLSALARIFVEAIFARHLRWAKERGLGEAQSGAVNHVQRFGSSVNLNVHFHVMVLDGVFTRDEPGRPLFHPAPPPTRDELDQVVRHVHRRAVAWLARTGTWARRSEARSRTRHAQTSLDACAAIAMGRGAVRAIRDDPGAARGGATGVDTPPADEERRRPRRFQPSRQRRHRWRRRPRTRAIDALRRTSSARARPPEAATGWAHRLSHQEAARRARQAPRDDAARVSGAARGDRAAAAISIAPLPWRSRAAERLAA